MTINGPSVSLVTVELLHTSTYVIDTEAYRADIEQAAF